MRPARSELERQAARDEVVALSTHRRGISSGMLLIVATKTATPWGNATVIEELRLPQRAGEKRFSSVVQLLEGERGEQFVRFAYATDGVARRGPVTLRARDLARLRTALAEHPGLADALGHAR